LGNVSGKFPLDKPEHPENMRIVSQHVLAAKCLTERKAGEDRGIEKAQKNQTAIRLLVYFSDEASAGLCTSFDGTETPRAERCDPRRRHPVRTYQRKPKALSLIRVINLIRRSTLRKESPFRGVGQDFWQFASAYCVLHFAPEFWMKQIAVLLRQFVASDTRKRKKTRELFRENVVHAHGKPWFHRNLLFVGP
jgi:hypothetical protein